MKEEPTFSSTFGSWLMQRDRGLRLALAFLCVFFLALFLHFREARFETLELNSIANRYIVAQTDFDFPDYETTIILKQQAMQDVGLIFQFDPKQIQQERYQLENLLIHTKDWRAKAPATPFEEMYQAIDALESLLLESRLTDGRTIQVVKELSLPSSVYSEFIPEGPEASGLTDEFWDQMAQRIAKKGSFHPETLSFLISFFQNQRWDLHEDELLERSIRNAVSKTIPEKLAHVSSGSKIVEPGERITSRHLTIMQAMKQTISDNRKIWELLPMIASLLLAFLIVGTGALYYRVIQPSFSRSSQQISLYGSILLLTFFLAKLVELVLVKSSSTLIEAIRYPIVVPFAVLLICILHSRRIALFAAVFLSIILSVGLAVDPSRFLIVNLIPSIVVIALTRNLHRRKDVFSVCLAAWLSSIPVLYSFVLSEAHLWNGAFLFDVGASFCFLLITAILVVGILPALETTFRVLTDMTLMEYLDPSNELLQKMAMQAPGTYQHCLVLANLSEACATSIGANGLFCRAATMYHDIGKIVSPQLYSENQQSSINVHQLLTPLESAQIIISHVHDGEELARKVHLPQPFIDIIRQHHGSTLVYYFYHKQLELKGGRKEGIVESQFRYPGPKPQTKEAAIIMICDSVEAASRSWENCSNQNLSETIDQLIAEKARDGQFDECNLTFEELSRIKQKLIKSLLLTNHIRIKYPVKEIVSK